MFDGSLNEFILSILQVFSWKYIVISTFLFSWFIYANFFGESEKVKRYTERELKYYNNYKDIAINFYLGEDYKMENTRIYKIEFYMSIELMAPTSRVYDVSRKERADRLFEINKHIIPEFIQINRDRTLSELLK